MEDFRLDPNIAYDVVELPSRGIHYANNKKSVRVSYLTASDENVLSSPNLALTNSIFDELLKRKVIDKDISVDDMVDEDKEAVLIFLRNTAFGSEYTVLLKDPKTNEEFKATVDLSALNFKEFNLVPDANGEYTYYMEKSKVSITFKFLNKKQEKELKDIETNYKGAGVAPIVTKELEKLIKSVNGNKDPMFIYNFIDKLPIKDSQDFRKYVNLNKPGLDLSRTVKAPSGEEVKFIIGFGVEFFRPFYGL
jgi:hypothetical protein